MDGVQAKVIERFPECADLVQRRLFPLRERYRKRARLYRLWYRGTGALVILLSVSLPLVANSAPFDYQILILSAISLAIAGITGLRSFFQWDQMWQLLRTAELVLRGLLLKWELDLSRFAHQRDDDSARGRAFARTEKLLEDLRDITKTEIETISGATNWPEI